MQIKINTRKIKTQRKTIIYTEFNYQKENIISEME
jgi:hypothetical protein